ncbi:unnamed protein product [Rhizoctonia solani]|uniref:Fungal-type protein kinase domain-containing protein n=1 Tax=Rhizoctonia solani TaxID=456999 RepID=A0A8H3BXC6_9AGAM|nr:unnamed protein product [Rhizoctonia solani]
MGDLTVEEEIYGNIFHDPNFFERFLSGPSTKLNTILKYCRQSNVYARRTNSWNPNPTTRVTRRSGSEPPLLKFLNTIIRGVHTMNPPDPNIPSSAPALFVDWPAEKRPTDMERYQLPDYLLFDPVTRDWPGIRTAVKLMTLPGHRKMGMVHLARYAKNIFAYQLHRRHVYHLMICGTEATFVRFDRGGVLYSSVVDICKDAETFIRAFASLMMLSRADEGYDPLFTAKKNADNSIVYYFDLPVGATLSQPGSDHEKPPARKFQVRKTLCHRSDIVGSATTVLLLRDVLEPTGVKPKPTRGKGKRKRVEPAPLEEEPRIGDTSYILKIVWRDPKEVKESDLYEKTNGMYGLAQHVWARDASRRCTCAEPKGECTTCVVEVGHIDGLEVCDILEDLIFTREEYDPRGEDKEGPELDTSEYRPATRKRPPLVYSYILMSSVGMYMDNAETPHQYMSGVLDAILGYWRLFNLGYIHRDISDGNVLLLKPGQALAQREWENPVTDLADIQDEEIRKSEEKLREVVAKLGRDPIGILVDFDRSVQHSGSVPVESKGEREFHGDRMLMPDILSMGPRKRQRTNTTKSYAFRDSSEPPAEWGAAPPVIEFRTGTRPFMSASVLGSTFGKPYRHSYLDDLESFFWLIYLSAVHHIDDGCRPNKHQRHEAAIFNTTDMKKLAKFKVQVVDRGDRMYSYLNLHNNSWSRSYVFQKVLSELEDFFRDVWYKKDPGMTPVEAFTRVTDSILDAIEGR